MYFLMAGKEEPLASFKALTAAMTIAAVGGWAGLALGLAAFLAGDLASVILDVVRSNALLTVTVSLLYWASLFRIGGGAGAGDATA